MGTGFNVGHAGHSGAPALAALAQPSLSRGTCPSAQVRKLTTSSTEAEQIPSEVRTSGGRSECLQTSLGRRPLRHKHGPPRAVRWPSVTQADAQARVCSSGSRGTAPSPRPQRGWGGGDPTLTASQGRLQGEGPGEPPSQHTASASSPERPPPHGAPGLVQSNVSPLVCPSRAGVGWPEPRRSDGLPYSQEGSQLLMTRGLVGRTASCVSSALITPHSSRQIHNTTPSGKVACIPWQRFAKKTMDLFFKK